MKRPSIVMRHLHLFLCIALLLCECKNSGEVGNTEGEPIAQVPGLKEEFSDTPGLTKTEVRNAADRVVSTGYLLNGKKESSWTEFTDTGLIKTVTCYFRDKKEGLFLEFNTGHQLLRRCYYHNDLRHGEYKEYRSLNVKEERYYENGKQVGVAKLFYDDGKLMEEAYYKNGVRDGVSKWYDQNGKLTIEYEYKNGQLVTK